MVYFESLILVFLWGQGKFAMCKNVAGGQLLNRGSACYTRITILICEWRLWLREIGQGIYRCNDRIFISSLSCSIFLFAAAYKRAIAYS
jgi:hypothetical protein